MGCAMPRNVLYNKNPKSLNVVMVDTLLFYLFFAQDDESKHGAFLI